METLEKSLCRLDEAMLWHFVTILPTDDKSWDERTRLAPFKKDIFLTLSRPLVDNVIPVAGLILVPGQREAPRFRS